MNAKLIHCPLLSSFHSSSLGNKCEAQEHPIWFSTMILETFYIYAYTYTYISNGQKLLSDLWSKVPYSCCNLVPVLKSGMRALQTRGSPCKPHANSPILATYGKLSTSLPCMFNYTGCVKSPNRVLSRFTALESGIESCFPTNLQSNTKIDDLVL